MRYVLVTGSSGLVGRALMKIAVPGMTWIGVTSADADLRDFQQVEQMIKKANEKHPLDGIIHLAANVGGLFKNMEQPVEMFEDNIMMNTNILKAAHNADIQNVVMCLSTCIFPDVVNKYPITSSDLHNGPPHASNEAYAHAKRMCDVMTRAYQKQYGRRYFCVVPTNIYGPHDNFDLANAHVIPALIHKCWLAKQAGEPFVVAGDGTPLRQFVFSEDLAKIIRWNYFEYSDIAKPFIICPPDSEVPISVAVDCIAEAFDYKDHVVYDTSKPNGQYKKTADSSLSEFYEFTPLKDGIRKTIEWFLEYPTPRGVTKNT